MRWPRAANRQVTVLLLVTVVLSACGQSGFYDQAYERLLSYVPNALRTTCERVEYSFLGIPGHPPQGELASAHCSSAWPPLVDITLFDSKEAMNQRYERATTFPPKRVVGTNCASPLEGPTRSGRTLGAEQAYAVDGEFQGTLFCEGYLGVGGFANIMWTDEHTLVLGFAQAGELGRLYSWWQEVWGAARVASN